jgi:signal peptidase
MGEQEGVEKVDEEKSAKEMLREFREDPIIKLIEDIVISVAIVGGIAVVLYGVSGIWPPMVAIESGSMEPGMTAGDIVFIVSPSNFVPDGVDARHGVVTHEQGEGVGYESFGDYGDAIVYRPNGNDGETAIIHRAMFYVEEGERWQTIEGETQTAPHDGFVTKGDANDEYDQAIGLSSVVKPEWIQGKAQYRVPLIGNLRLLFPSSVTPSGTDVAPVASAEVGGGAPACHRGA